MSKTREECLTDLADFLIELSQDEAFQARMQAVRERAAAQSESESAVA